MYNMFSKEKKEKEIFEKNLLNIPYLCLKEISQALYVRLNIKNKCIILNL